MVNADNSTILFSAILSINAYNRGCNQAVGGLSNAPGTQIGNATINMDSLYNPNFAADGLYTLSCSSSGEIVVSYRDTDNLSLSPVATAIFGTVGSRAPV
jgi:hypothetical protein